MVTQTNRLHQLLLPAPPQHVVQEDLMLGSAPKGPVMQMLQRVNHTKSTGVAST